MSPGVVRVEKIEVKIEEEGMRVGHLNTANPTPHTTPLTSFSFSFSFYLNNTTNIFCHPSRSS